MKGQVLHLNQDWIVGDLIDNGGFGKVYEVTDAAGSQQAAAKFVPKAPQAGRELLFVDLPGVPNVVPVIDHGEHAEYHVLVMPLADRSLRTLLSDEPVPPLEVTLTVLIDVAEALTALDGKVVHRDLKPENVLYLNGKWCLADFGISRYADASTATHTSKSAWSMPYAAPERWRFEHAEPSTDIYSLGVMASEMLMGQRPFPGPTEHEFRDQHLRQDAPKVTAGPVPLQSLVAECLYKSANTRPRAANVLARLKTFKAAPAVGALAALQNANRAQVSAHSERARQASAAKTEAEVRTAMFKDASTAFELICQQIAATVRENAPAAEVDNRVGSLTISLGDGRLQIPLPAQIQPGDQVWRSPINVIAATHIAVEQYDYARQGYKGRGHSLWFCDAITKDELQWYETAFMDLSMTRSSMDMAAGEFQPHSLPPDGEADRALGAALDIVQVAWPFTPLRPGDLDDFLERWIGWFAEASANNLYPPAQLPERGTGSWRR